MYILKVDQFEGPLELLLSLIEKRQMDITRLSLAHITEEYLDFLAAREVSLEHLSSFLAVAAQLLLIKSKSLLPFLELGEEEEETMEDLEFRLREYKKFKEAALRLGALFDAGKQTWPRETLIDREPFFYPPAQVDGAVLARMFEAVLGSIPVAEVLDQESLEEVITLEEKILSLRELFTADRTEASFHEVASGAQSRTEIIVSFLALLELVKQRILHADQDELFVEIRLRQHRS